MIAATPDVKIQKVTEWFETAPFGGVLRFSTNETGVRYFIRIFFTPPFLSSPITANSNHRELCRL